MNAATQLTQPVINIMTHALDDSPVILKLIEKAFENAGINQYRLFAKEQEFIDAINEDVHIAVIDYMLGGPLTGLDVLRILIDKNPRCYVIIMSGQEEKKVVVDFLNAGAWKYVDKTGEFVTEVIGYVQQAATLVKENLTFYHTLLTKVKNREDESFTGSRENVAG